VLQLRRVGNLSISTKEKENPVMIKVLASSTFKSVLGLVFALGLVSNASAQNVHFKRTPTFADIGQQLRATISLAGLGNGDVTITLAASGSGTTTCFSPGGNPAPGQNKVAVSSTVSTTVPTTQIKNGNLQVVLTTPVPATPTPAEAGCPNNNWTVQLSDVSFSTATVSVVQGGVTVLTRTFDLEQ
jgi:hypothetical protein